MYEDTKTFVLFQLIVLKVNIDMDRFKLNDLKKYLKSKILSHPVKKMVKKIIN